MKEPLSQMGDSLVVVTDDDLLKVHVHTNQPGVAITLAQKYGDIQTIKVENMRNQHTAVLAEQSISHTPVQEKPKQRTKYAIIAVASGEGIHEAFTELGVDLIIGGQTIRTLQQALFSCH